MSVEDIELGTIKLQPNDRAKRVIVRYRNGIFLLTHPSFMSRQEILKTIESMKPDLHKLRKKAAPEYIFSEDSVFQTHSFQVIVKPNTQKNIYTSLKDGFLHITYPKHIDVEDSEFQLYIKKLVEDACRFEAKRLLPERVRFFAKQHNFIVNDIKINKSRSRWGSCSGRKDINLSYFCMMLPKHLIDFVILHELCHTVEMNHGPRFWTLLDSISGNEAKELTQELKMTKLKW